MRMSSGGRRSALLKKKGNSSSTMTGSGSSESESHVVKKSDKSKDSKEPQPSTPVVDLTDDEPEPLVKRVRFKGAEINYYQEKKEKDRTELICNIMDDFNRNLDCVIVELKSTTKRQKKLEKEMATLHARADNIEKAVGNTIEKFENTIKEIDGIINTKRENGNKRKKRALSQDDEKNPWIYPEDEKKALICRDDTKNELNYLDEAKKTLSYLKDEKKALSCLVDDLTAMKNLPTSQNNLGIFTPSNIPDNLTDVIL